MTKAKCPVCRIIGFLEQRGSNMGIKNYAGFENGSRKYVLHEVAEEKLLGINGY